jgi:hypothetical protein
MKYIWFGILLASCAAVVASECRPEGRGTFTAGLQALAGGDLSVAAARFADLVQAQPDCAEARNDLAVVEVEQGRLQEAAAELRVAMRLRPDYQRARFNLQRVEELLAGQEQPTPSPTPSAVVPSPTVTQEHDGVATITPTPTTTHAAPTAQPPAPATPNEAVAAGIAALEPLGATACVLDSARGRVCLYNRTGQGVILCACYWFSGSHVAAWPRWLVVSDTGGRRIRLLDEDGHLRLKVVPERANVAGDVVRLRQDDFGSLSAGLRPWRTACVMADSVAELEPAMLAAVRDALQAWLSAWEQRRFQDYVVYYSQTFVPQSDPDVAHWRARKQQLFASAGSITVEIASPSIFFTDNGATVIMLFDQRYRSDTTTAHEVKALRWQREAGAWKITAETVLRPNPPQ